MHGFAPAGGGGVAPDAQREAVPAEPDAQQEAVVAEAEPVAQREAVVAAAEPVAQREAVAAGGVPDAQQKAVAAAGSPQQEAVAESDAQRQAGRKCRSGRLRRRSLVDCGDGDCPLLVGNVFGAGTGVTEGPATERQAAVVRLWFRRIVGFGVGPGVGDGLALTTAAGSGSLLWFQGSSASASGQEQAMLRRRRRQRLSGFGIRGGSASVLGRELAMPWVKQKAAAVRSLWPAVDRRQRLTASARQRLSAFGSGPPASASGREQAMRSVKEKAAVPGFGIGNGRFRAWPGVGDAVGETEGCGCPLVPFGFGAWPPGSGCPPLVSGTAASASGLEQAMLSAREKAEVVRLWCPERCALAPGQEWPMVSAKE